MTTRFCPRCQENHSNRRNCDGSKRTVDERIIGQQERLTGIYTDHAEGAAEQLLRIGPENLRAARWSKGGSCQLCRGPARNTRIITISVPDRFGIYIVHENCAKRFFHEYDTSGMRAEAAAHGQMLMEEGEKALGEPLLAQGRCIYMGEARSPEFEPKGGAFRGFALAGKTRFGFVMDGLQKACWSSYEYKDVCLVTYRSEEQVAPQWVVEFAHQPVEGLYAGSRIHICARLPAGVQSSAVTSVILAGIKEKSRFDQAKKVSANDMAEGLVLLPITPDASAEMNTILD